jgi:TetR/AcrR family transcriptional regulator, transcriptional repressor for nem operon
MDIAPNRKALTHERILETAARAIRRAGFQGVGVADIMKEAGLTHGGFYAHFASRDALLVEALEHAGRHSAQRLDKGQALRQARGVSAFRALVEGYLSDQHLGDTEKGCAVAALASEMPRQAPEVREAAAQRVRGLVGRVRDALPTDAAPEVATAVASQMVGALQLARALGNNAEGRALLAANRSALLAQHGGFQ